MPGAKDKEKCGLGQNCWFDTLETSKFIVIIFKSVTFLLIFSSVLVILYIYFIILFLNSYTYNILN